MRRTMVYQSVERLLRQTLLIGATVGILCTITSLTYSQSVTEASRRQAEKACRYKSAKKQAKQMRKRGWEPVPGSMPLADQFYERCVKSRMVDEKGMNLFIFATGNAVAEQQAVAMRHAIHVAKVQLAQTIQGRIVGIVKDMQANQQLDQKTAVSINEMLSATRDILVQRLGYVEPVVQMIRYLPGDQVEVQVILAYNVRNAFAVARQIMREELRQRLQKTEEEVDRLLDQILGEASGTGGGSAQ